MPQPQALAGLIAGLLTIVLTGALTLVLTACHEPGPAVAPEVPRLPWPAATVPCDKEGFVPVWERATWESRPPTDSTPQGSVYFRYEARDSLDEPFNELLVESYASPDYQGPDAPGRYVLDGTNYADCGLCIRIRTHCYGNWCEDTYFAGQGAVDIAAIGPGGTQFQAAFRALGLRDADIDPGSLVSTVTEESTGWCIPEFDVDVPIKEAGAESGCSTLGTGTTLGEGISNFTLTNCLGESTSLHDSCGGDSNVVWLVATAGWCAACSSWLPEVFRTLAERQGGGIEVMVVLGEDGAGNAPTQAYCDDYARAHGIPANQVFIDYGVLSGWQNLFSHISPYLSGGYLTLPWNGLLDATNMEYVWTDAASTTSVYEALDTLIGK